VAVLGLIAGAATGYWRGDSNDGTTEAELRDGVESIQVDETTPNTADQDAAGLSEHEKQALATLDDWTAALNTGDMDLVNSFYADDAQLGWIVDGVEVPVDRDEYFTIHPRLAGTRLRLRLRRLSPHRIRDGGWGGSSS
jgi:hypothetical protein